MLPILVLILFSPLIIVAMLTLDELVIIERERFPIQWEYDGRPATIFRQKKQFKPDSTSSFAMNKLFLVWLFTTPLWVEKDEKAASLLRRFRILVVIWNFVAVPLFLVFNFLIVYYFGN